jgi:hypothetical protein
MVIFIFGVCHMKKYIKKISTTAITVIKALSFIILAGISSLNSFLKIIFRYRKTLFLCLCSLSGSVFYNHKEILNDLIKLASAEGSSIIAIENASTFCSSLKNPANPSQAQISQIFDQQKIISDALKTLVDQHRIVGMNMTYGRYLQIHELTCWNDYILGSGIHLCTIPFKPRDRMDKWKADAWEQIDQEKLRHSKPLQMLKDYLIFIRYHLPGKNTDTAYSSAGCDFKKIANY